RSVPTGPATRVRLERDMDAVFLSRHRRMAPIMGRGGRKVSAGLSYTVKGFLRMSRARHRSRALRAWRGGPLARRAGRPSPLPPPPPPPAVWRSWRALARVRGFARPRLLASPLRRRSGPLSDWFFTSDLHGQGRLYEELVALVAARHPRVVIIRGG